MGSHPLQVWVAAILFGLAAAVLVLAVARAGRGGGKAARFRSAMESIAGSELQLDTRLEPTTSARRDWTGFWGDLWAQTGRRPSDPKQPGRVVGAAAVIGAVAGWVGLGGPAGAVVVAVAPVGLIYGWLTNERRKRTATMEQQLPELLSGLRAYLSARMTPQTALMQVAEDLPAPLGDELRALRDDLNVNRGLLASLEALSRRVVSPDMRFLVASIQVAVETSVALEPQLEVIQDIVVQRARGRAALRGAMAKVKPTQYLATIAVPGMFVFSFFTSENPMWWFNGGLIALIIMCLLYVSAFVVVRMMVKSVEDLS